MVKPSKSAAARPALIVSKKELSKGATPAQIDRALLDEMSRDARAATPDQLKKIRKLAREMRDIDIDNERLKEQIEKNNARREEIKWHDLLDAMDTAGMRAMTLEAEGNMPAYEVKTGAYYHANISVDWETERRAAAFAWIDKHESGMLRSVFTVELPKNSRAVQKKVQAALRKLRVPFAQEFGVPWNTLTAYVREQIEEHGATPPLELLGATVGRIATIKKVKEK